VDARTDSDPAADCDQHADANSHANQYTDAHGDTTADRDTHGPTWSALLDSGTSLALRRLEAEERIATAW
jgi:hypothetical protein